MRWTAPPTRREVTLVFFALTTFILSYNIEFSLRLIGLEGGGISSRLWRGRGGAIDKDGRKPRPWRDRLETEIFGDWRWDEGHVAGDGEERQQAKGSDRYGAMWSGKIVTKETTEREQVVFGGTRVHDGMVELEGGVPETHLVKHIPGYTILDSVFFVNGTMILVSDDPSTLPSLSSIASSSQNSEWQVWSTVTAKEELGDYIANIDGVTWISNDQTPHNHTLLSLWRTYSVLDPQISSTGHTTLAAPRRIFFPSIPTFSDHAPDDPADLRPRVRSQAGFHPLLAKTAFPTLGLLFKEDWEDFAKLGLPFRFQRLVIADRGAAARSASPLVPETAGPFEQLTGSDHWLQPVRRALAASLGVELDGRQRKPVVTYVATQGESAGPRLRDADHRVLVDSLQKIGVEVRVVSGDDMPWGDFMRTILRSTVVLGPYGQHMTDGLYMQQGGTLIEFFPAGVFVRDQAFPVRALGSHYVAFQNEQKFTGDALPAAYAPPPHEREAQAVISLDVRAVIETVREAVRG
ncbi:hypothetical protein PLICRDRAFT_176414 [Plicaturopsis crispa FD-325 SS-3]|nr:hypothetical protein PLICRDRAFT_176414 [Plicaturopsis crispa FD-325 SS-3]